MDFYAEAERRKLMRLGKIGELAYRRFQCAQAIREAEVEIEELDTAIVAHEEAVKEIEQQQRNFNTYLAVKEGALTTEQIAEGVRAAAEAEPSETQAIDEAGQ